MNSKQVQIKNPLVIIFIVSRGFFFILIYIINSMSKKIALEDVVALAKRRGFIYPGSDLYGGLANTYDYGPYGVEMKKNIKELWWEKFIHDRNDMYGIESSIFLNPKVWKASGHTESFVEIVVEDKVQINGIELIIL